MSVSEEYWPIQLPPFPNHLPIESEVRLYNRCILMYVLIKSAVLCEPRFPDGFTNTHILQTQSAATVPTFTLTSNTATLGSRWRDEPSGWPTSSAAGRGGCRAAAASGGLSLPSEPLELGRRAAGVAGVPFAALLGSLSAPAGAEMSGMGALAVGWRAPLPMPSCTASRRHVSTAHHSCDE